jgi:hypothetical protein
MGPLSHLSSRTDPTRQGPSAAAAKLAAWAPLVTVRGIQSIVR